MSGCPKFEDLREKVLTKIENRNNEELVFTVASDEVYKLYHHQQCCESVAIEDICGDLDDLIGEPLLVAEEVKRGRGVNPEIVPAGGYQDSFTWTFYKLDTRKGGVTVRWYGRSNGYYSESVDFCRVASNTDDGRVAAYVRGTDYELLQPATVGELRRFLELFDDECPLMATNLSSFRYIIDDKGNSMMEYT